MNTTIKAYQEVCKYLGIKQAKIAESELSGPPDTTTVIIPNQVVSVFRIVGLAVLFGQDQPQKTYVYEDLYEKYTDEELSGPVQGDKPYRIIHIPKKRDEKYETVAEALETHKGQHVPSVLEAICYWFTLRAAGETLNFDSTYIRHFDLEPKDTDGLRLVPESYVYDDGRPRLFYSLVGDAYGVRVAVGYNLEPLPSPSAVLELPMPDVITVGGVEYARVK